MADHDPLRFNLAAHVLAAGGLTPNKIALAILTLTGAERWSYQRLTDAVLGAGGWLLAQGLRPGDRVMIRMGNNPGYPVLYLGAIAAGLVPVATSEVLTAPEVSRMAETVAPRAIVADPGLSVPDDPAPGLTVLPADLPLWERHPPCDWHFGPEEREAYIVFTSGTSGRPLAVRHAHRAILARAMMISAWEGLVANDRLLHSGAFNWTYTMGTGLLDPWTVGATAMIAAPSVSLEHLGLVLRRHDVTVLATVPTLLRRLLRGDMPSLPRLRHALSAGEALSPELRAQWQARSGTDVIEALGCSEISTFISGRPDRPAPAGATGFPQPGRRVAVLDDAGAPLPLGEIGRLAISTSDPGLMLGYVGHPPPDGAWFQTGDLVHQDHAGAVYYHGRADEMMNPGGIRVSPREVESALIQMPGVTDLAVAEVEVSDGVRIIACFYVSLAPLDEDAANAFAAATLARYKCPRIWAPVAMIPRGPTGKVLRRRLAETITKA